MKRKLKFKNKLDVPFIYKPYNAKEMAKRNKQTNQRTFLCKNTQKGFKL